MSCSTCGRRPSEADKFITVEDYGGVDFETERCPDPIHDLADEAPALKESLDAARLSNVQYINLLPAVETARDAAQAELAASKKLLQELVETSDDVSPGSGSREEGDARDDAVEAARTFLKLGALPQPRAQRGGKR